MRRCWGHEVVGATVRQQRTSRPEYHECSPLDQAVFRDKERYWRAADTHACVAGPRCGKRLRRGRLQREQHGAGASRDGGGQPHRCAGDHPGQSGRAGVFKRGVSAPPDAGGHGIESAHSGGHAPGSRQQSGNLPERDGAGLYQRDDGRLAAGRRLHALRLLVQRGRHP